MYFNIEKGIFKSYKSLKFISKNSIVEGITKYQGKKCPGIKLGCSP